MKKLMALAVATVVAVGANADPNRSLYTKENRFPDKGQLELGGVVGYRDFELWDETSLTPYARYGWFSNMTVNAAVPFGSTKADYGDDGTGFGDVVLGLDLVAWQDIFDYPFIIPHVSLGLPTGDEDQHLGKGETVVTPGVSVGSVMYDVLRLVVDGSYAVNGGGTVDNRSDLWLLSCSAIWEISEQFSVQGEVQVGLTEDSNNNAPTHFVGGMTYEFTPRFEMTAYFGGGGGGNEGEEEEVEKSLFGLKGAYSF